MTHYHYSGRIYLVDREEPKEFLSKETHAWDEYLTTCPSYPCRIEGLREGVVELGKDFVLQYEWMPGVSPVWVECTEEEYNIAPDNLRRKVAVAPPVQPSTMQRKFERLVGQHQAADGSTRIHDPGKQEGEVKEHNEFIQKHLKRVKMKIGEAKEQYAGQLIDKHIKRLYDGLERASVEYFVEKGVISGAFYLSLVNMITEAMRPPSRTDSAEGKGEFLVLKFGHIYVDANLLHKGIYEDERPVLFEKTETFDSFIQRHKDIQQYSGETDEQIAKVEENLRRCSFVPVVLAPPVSAQQIGDAFTAGVINAQRQKAGKDFITQEQYLASLPSQPSEGYTAGEVDLIEDAMNAYYHQGQKELGRKDIGDIEKKNWDRICAKLKEWFRKRR